MNLMTLGICGVGQQIQLDHCARADGNLAWILLTFLSAVCPIPYSTSPSAEFIHYGIVLLVYRFKIFLLGLTRYWSWSCESKNKPGADDFVAETHPGGGAADVVAQSLYACGAGLCFLNTHDRIAAIVLVERN